MDKLIKVMSCGGVDDGKSTLIGHLIYEATKYYSSKKELDKLDSYIGYKNGTVKYSTLLDSNSSEVSQGITVSSAYKFFKSNKRDYIIIDTPGHIEYLSDMVSSATKVDVAIVVISAKTSLTEQTKRHIKICNLVGIKNIIFAVNKIDLVDNSEEVYTNISNEINNYILSFRFTSIHIIPLSAKMGTNLFVNKSTFDFYKGLSLLECLDSISINKPDVFNMSITKVVNPNQNFRGYQGIVKSGILEVGDLIKNQLTNNTLTVDELYYLDKKVNKIEKDMSVTIKFKEDVLLECGDILSNQLYINDSKILVDIINISNKVLTKGMHYKIRIHNKELNSIVEEVNYYYDQDNNKVDTDIIEPNFIGNVVLRLSNNANFTTVNVNNIFSNFTLYSLEGEIVSVGCIIDKVETRKQNIVLSKEKRSLNLNQTPISFYLVVNDIDNYKELGFSIESYLYNLGKTTTVINNLYDVSVHNIISLELRNAGLISIHLVEINSTKDYNDIISLRENNFIKTISISDTKEVFKDYDNYMFDYLIDNESINKIDKFIKENI